MSEQDYRALLEDELPEREYILDFGGRTTLVSKAEYIDHLVMMKTLMPEEDLTTLN